MLTTRDALVQVMIEAGVTRVFTLPGLGITWSLEAFARRAGEIDVVLARSEHIASIMAQVDPAASHHPATDR